MVEKAGIRSSTNGKIKRMHQGRFIINLSMAGYCPIIKHSVIEEWHWMHISVIAIDLL